MIELGDGLVRFKNGIVAKRLTNGKLKILPSNQWGNNGRKIHKQYLKKNKQKGGLTSVSIENSINQGDSEQMIIDKYKLGLDLCNEKLSGYRSGIDIRNNMLEEYRDLVKKNNNLLRSEFDIGGGGGGGGGA